MHISTPLITSCTVIIRTTWIYPYISQFNFHRSCLMSKWCISHCMRSVTLEPLVPCSLRRHVDAMFLKLSGTIYILIWSWVLTLVMSSSSTGTMISSSGLSWNAMLGPFTGKATTACWCLQGPEKHLVSPHYLYSLWENKSLNKGWCREVIYILYITFWRNYFSSLTI